MRRISKYILVLVLILSLSAPYTAVGLDANNSSAEVSAAQTQSVIVLFEPDSDSQQVVQDVAKLPAVDANEPIQTLITDDSATLDSATVELSDALPNAQAIAQIENLPDVKAVIPNVELELLDLPNDPFFTTNGKSPVYQKQWWLPSVGAPAAWDRAKSDGKVSVAVIDTGVRMDHEDLIDDIDFTHAWDVTKNKQLTSAAAGFGDTDGHGTHVAGIIAARANNGLGGVGISYNAKIVPIKTQTDSGYITLEYVLNAINYATGLKTSGKVPTLRVINLSLGVYKESFEGYTEAIAYFQSYIRAANKAGILVVSAAGNNGTADVIYPSDFAEVLSVTSTTVSDSKAAFSNINAYKDIAAPGQEIWSTYGNSADSYKSSDGTSMSAPIVAGAAALAFASKPTATPASVKLAIYNTATDLGTPGRDNSFGYGKLNVDAMLAALDSASYKAVNLTFDAHSGKIGKKQTSTISQVYGKVLAKAPKPKKTGYTFLGWYTKTSGGTQIFTASGKANAAKSGYTSSDREWAKPTSTKLYAHWKLKSAYRQVKFNVNKGQALSKAAAKKAVKKSAKVSTMPKPVRKHYKFKGWYTKKKGGVRIYTSTRIVKSRTLYAHWSKK